MEITEKQMGLLQQTAPLIRSQKALAKRPPKIAPWTFNPKIKSKFSSWKQEFETDFISYQFEFDREEDKIV
jgi:hypothetical protein